MHFKATIHDAINNETFIQQTLVQGEVIEYWHNRNFSTCAIFSLHNHKDVKNYGSLLQKQF